jgi:uncharacterized protein (TIGR00251 family)
LSRRFNINARGDVLTGSTSSSGFGSGFDSGQQLDVASVGGCAVFQVRVQPRASRDEVAGVIGGALKVRVQAPAIESRANEAVCEFLATLLKRPKSAVRILAGEHSRVKRVEIRGVEPREILALLSHEA